MPINAAKSLPPTTALARATPQTGEIQMKSAARAASPQPGELIELLQVSHARFDSAHYTLFEGRFLAVHRKRPLRNAQRYWIDIGFLDPTPHLLTIVDRRWLYAAALLAVTTAGLLAATALSETPWHQQAWLPGTILMLNATLVSLAAFFQRSRSLVRFHSRHGDAVLLELASGLPSRAEFREFISTLIQRIHATHRSDPGKPYRRLGAELVEHRRLHDAGILDRDAYDQAREKILRKHRQANIRPVPRPKPAPQAHAEADIIEITLAEGVRHTDVTTVELFEK